MGSIQQSAVVVADRRPRRGEAAAIVLLVAVVMLTALLVLAPGDVLVPIASALVLDRPPQPADAVVVSPDMTRTGLREAVDLWQRGVVGYLLVSNAAIDGPPGTGADEWSDLALRELGAADVPDDAIVVVDGRPCSSSAYVEAIRVAAAEHGFRRLILLAPQLMTRRVQSEWSALLAPAGIDVQVAAYQRQQVALERWWKNRPGVNAVFNAYLAYLIDHVPIGPYPGC